VTVFLSRELLQRRAVGYAVSIVGVLAVAVTLRELYPEARPVTTATGLLIVVLLAAVVWGMGPALAASVLGAVYLNFSYTSSGPRFEFRMVTGDELVALVAFLVTSILVGQLSSRAQRRAQENRRLYDQLAAAFDRASELEGIKQSEQLKSALLDTVTHDLRTPLTSIKAAATALIDVRRAERQSSESARDPQKHLLDIIVQQSDRLNHFIEGMIELAKVEAGTLTGQQTPEATSIEEIILATLVRAGDLLKYHKVNVECEDNLTAAVIPKAIGQVLFSLLENSARLARPDTVVRIVARRMSKNEVQIAVEDEGPGIPPHLREKVFQKFFRHDPGSSKTTRSTGLGFGLAIAHKIVQAHGGAIWIEDRPNGAPGARFVFALPAGTRVTASQGLPTL